MHRRNSNLPYPEALLAIFAGGIVGGGCDHHGPTAECAPEYGGAGSDEAWMAMVDAESAAMIDMRKAVLIMEPAEAQVFAPGAGPAKIKWTSPLSSAVDAPTPSRELRHQPRPRPRSALASLGRLIIGEAWAHLPPVTGEVAYLQIPVPGEKCEVRALTTEKEWQLTAAQWAALKKAAGQPLSLQITNAYLRENRVTEGPYRPEMRRTFTVTP